MGCTCTKSTQQAAVEFDDLELSPKHRTDSNKTAEPAVTPASDVAEKNKVGTTSIVSELVNRNWDAVTRKYKVNQFAVLGRGGCGSVCVAEDISTGKKYAMKTVSLNEFTLQEVVNEIEIQKNLDHPNIARVYEYYVDEAERGVHIIMEMCTGGTLVGRMRRYKHGLAERRAATLVEKMLGACLYCHQRGVIHRDIKLDNFLYEDDSESAELKLIDFGFATEVQPGKESMYSKLGTRSYMAPELWQSRRTPYGPSVDVWAIGVCAYMLLSGTKPFYHESDSERKRMIEEDDPNFDGPTWERVSDEGINFCQYLMTKDPATRPSPSQALAHPWLKIKSTLHSEDPVELGRQQSVVKNLISFSRSDEVRQVAREVIAFSIPPNEVEKLRSLFVGMDRDNSGTVSEEEFSSALSSRPDIDARLLFRLIDVNHSGELDYSEFIAPAAGVTEAAKPSLTAAFSILDRDSDGFLTKAELRKWLGMMVEDTQRVESLLEEIMADSDETGDGKLAYEEFKNMLIKEMSSPRGSKARFDWRCAAEVVTATAVQRLTSPGSRKPLDAADSALKFTAPASAGDVRDEAER